MGVIVKATKKETDVVNSFLCPDTSAFLAKVDSSKTKEGTKFAMVRERKIHSQIYICVCGVNSKSPNGSINWWLCQEPVEGPSILIFNDLQTTAEAQH